jgi:hypothetical protein
MRRLERGQQHRDFGKCGPGDPAVLRVSPELRFETANSSTALLAAKSDIPRARWPP